MPDDIRVSVIDALVEYNPNLNPTRLLKLCLALTIVVNITCATVLVLNTNNISLSNWKSILTQKNDFYTNTLDIFMLTILQSICLPVVAFIAIYSGRNYMKQQDVLNESDQEVLSVTAKYCSCFRCCYNISSNLKIARTSINKSKYDRVLSFDSQRNSEGGQPLLAMVDDNEFLEPSPSAGLEGYEHDDQRKKNDRKTIDEKYLFLRKNLDTHKSFWLGVIFVLSTTCQVYIGLKCISFEFKNEKRDGSLMGLGVLWVNIITWFLRELIQRSANDDGEYIPALHMHKLHLHLSLGSHWCDLCGQQCKDGRAFRCKLCDFDLCMVCYSKKGDLKFTLEGQLRGDSGIKNEESLTNDRYFMRALALVREEYKIFSIAILALMATNGINLLMPNVQGTILNSVVEGDDKVFNYWVKAYLIISISSGFFGGIQSLCFNVVGRKLTNTIRKKMFRGIVIQDVAFFDGNSSGQLTSRLTNDVGFMVTPIQSMLGTLISNSILLLGGISLCFYTSWRLSMLAFTTVGPIIHITQVYSTWSKSLNRRIYGALAAANGFATEALGNIRTVKSFSTENYEQNKYNDANDNALVKGIRDAFGGAGMYTINSYLELGASVLILWYGGLMAMEGKDSMSPGRLITYQLYWNMLNNSYKNLLDIITSFTRAAGAAQRVFSLMDSLPDIDIDAGKRLTKDEIKGEIRLNSLTFSYQMRPNAKVLDEVDLVIPAGSTCALVGRSGGGKSTIVNLIMRFYDPKGGSITIDGSNLKELCLRDVRRSIGLVQQNTELFGGTIEENITYGLEP
eukprot:gene16156-21962_t